MCMKKKPIVNYASRKSWQVTETPKQEETETMRTNILMEMPLVTEAQAVTGIKTKTGVIHHALRELVRRERMKEILEFRGKVDFWDGYEAAVRG